MSHHITSCDDDGDFQPTPRFRRPPPTDAGPSTSSQYVSIGAGVRPSGNVSIGASAGPFTSSGNVSIGASAGASSSSGNVSIGAGAGLSTSGGNVSIGAGAGPSIYIESLSEVRNNIITKCYLS